MLKKMEAFLEKFLLRSDSEDKEFLPPAVEILENPLLLPAGCWCGLSLACSSLWFYGPLSAR